MAVMPSMPVAQEGYEGFVHNRRVVVTGGRNKMLVSAVKMLPRAAVLRTVRRMQEPA
jgi:short-subunit dehydrogenase